MLNIQFDGNPDTIDQFKFGGHAKLNGILSHLNKEELEFLQTTEITLHIAKTAGTAVYGDKILDIYFDEPEEDIEKNLLAVLEKRGIKHEQDVLSIKERTKAGTKEVFGTATSVKGLLKAIKKWGDHNGFDYEESTFGPLTPQKVEAMIDSLKKMAPTDQGFSLKISPTSLSKEAAKALAEFATEKMEISIFTSELTIEAAEELANLNCNMLTVTMPNLSVVPKGVAKKLASYPGIFALFIGREQQKSSEITRQISPDNSLDRLRAKYSSNMGFEDSDSERNFKLSAVSKMNRIFSHLSKVEIAFLRRSFLSLHNQDRAEKVTGYRFGTKNNIGIDYTAPEDVIENLLHEILEKRMRDALPDLSP